MLERHPVLPIASLSNRHPVLTPAIAATYIEAAAVCLSRHHEAPTDFELEDNNESIVLLWKCDRPKPEWRGEIRSIPLNPSLMPVPWRRC